MNNAGPPTCSKPLGNPSCHVCQGFGDLKNPRGRLVERKDESGDIVCYDYTYMHHPNLGALLKSAEAGCGMCIMIRENFKEYDDELEEAAESSLSEHDTDAQSDKSSRATNNAEPAEIEEVTLSCVYEEKTDPRVETGARLVRVARGSRSWSVMFFFNSGYDPLDPGLEHRPSRDLLSEAHTDLVNRWRATCKEEHESCRVATGDQPLPSRVLLLSDPKNEESGVRLIETGGKVQGIYACLSYCWGDQDIQIGQTNIANLSRQQQGIAFKDLPSTVVDTIRLCYKLGIQYLWVDRLCIIQDDENDWSAEASRMCDVYSRSAITISVPICSQSSQSFLYKRHKGFQEQDQFSIVEYTDEERGFKGSFWFTDECPRRNNGPWALEETWTVHHGPEDKGRPWLRRGWTFQEWMLSPRVLHIDSMTIWDCFDGYANEISRRNMEEARLERNPKHYATQITWEAIVYEYSQRELTFGKDRLPALAGLAARYGKETGYTYLAGLWREGMPRTLLWRRPLDRSRPLADQRHPANEIAPSWSWVRLNGPVEFMNQYGLSNFSAKASIAAFHCRPSPPDSFSVVEEAWIDVEGPLCAVTEQMDKVVTYYVGTGFGWWESIPDDRTSHQMPYPDGAIAEGDVCLLLIGVSPHTETSTKYYGLVLQLWGNRDGRRCYERLGVATCIRDGGPPSVWEGPWESQLIRLI